MEDAIFGELSDSKCPRCGSRKVVCYIQYPLIVKRDMKGHIIRTDNITGKRMKLTNEWMARMFQQATTDEYQVANYECEDCEWTSKPYTP